MKTSTSTRSPSKDGRAIDVSRILDYYINIDGTCKTCGHNHSFKFNYEVKTSIDILPKLFKQRKILEC